MESQLLELSLCLIENICIFLFIDHLLVRRFSQILSVFLAVCINTSVDYSIKDFGLIYRMLISITVTLVLCLVLYRVSIYTIFFFLLLSKYIFCIIDVIIGNILTVLINQSILHIFYENFWDRLIICLIVKLLDGMAFYYLYRILRKTQLLFHAKFWILFDIIMLGFLAITLIFMTYYEVTIPSDPLRMIYTGLAFLFFAMSMIVIYFFTYIADSFNQNEKLLILKKSYASISDSLTAQNENSTQLKKIRHDIKNHLFLVQSFLKKGDTEMAETILNSVTEQAEQISISISKSTNNSVLDAIISYKAAIIKSKKIRFEYSLEPLPELSIDPIDISSIISNLLDNAMEAAGTTSNPYVQLQIFMHNNYLSIFVKNTYSGYIASNPVSNSFPVTSKNDKQNHGYGMMIIQELAGKYSGDFVWKTDDQYFIANVILKNEGSAG